MPPLIGATLLTLAACATTSVTPTALDDPDGAAPATVPLAPVTAIATVAPTEAPASTEAATTTVVETTTTVAETTTTSPKPRRRRRDHDDDDRGPQRHPAGCRADRCRRHAQRGRYGEGAVAVARARVLGAERRRGVRPHHPPGRDGVPEVLQPGSRWRARRGDGGLDDGDHRTARARADAGTLVEIDKAKQLLFFVIDGRTQWILNTSTGNGEPYEEQDKNTPGEVITGISITPNGLHKVYRERAEGWWPGDLGEIYRPKYFSGGAAVHGSNSIPNYPASHGCVRISVPAMDWVWEINLMPMGTPVWVHEGA